VNATNTKFTNDFFWGATNRTDTIAYPEETASYVVWNDTATNKVYAKNGHTGQIDYSGTGAAAVINAVWASMASGGRIHLKGTINLGATPLVFNLIKYVKDLILTGDGETSTRIIYTGAGAAITVTTADVAPGYYNFLLQDFCLDGVTVTGGRNGIAIDKVGRTGILSRVKVYNMDIGIDIGVNPNDTNEVYLYDCAVIVANTGFRVKPCPTNEINFYNCRAVDTVNYGYYIEGGTSIRLYGCIAVSASGVGLCFYGTWGAVVDGFRSEPNGASTCDILITGTDSSFPCKGVKISGSYFNGGSLEDYSIKIEYGEEITIDTCVSRLHNIAFIYLYNNPQFLTVINPDIITPELLLDGANASTLPARIAGSVITPQATGEIVKMAITATNGDVLYLVGEGVWSAWYPVGSEAVPGVVLFGNVGANTPGVIATAGVCAVNSDVAIARGDRLVLAAGGGEYKKATKYVPGIYGSVLGTAVETIGGAGLVNIFIQSYVIPITNSGTFSIALHSKTATVTHGLSYTPTASDIGITWTSSLTNCTSWSVTGISSTQFTVNLYDANGAAKGPSGTVTGSWKSIKTP
jgi:hypothetical protein